jgi:hypothetical protein
MGTGRGSPGVLTAHGKIVVGDAARKLGAEAPLTSSEVYDRQADQWDPCQLSSRRGSASLCAARGEGNEILTIGGFELRGRRIRPRGGPQAVAVVDRPGSSPKSAVLGPHQVRTTVRDAARPQEATTGRFADQAHLPTSSGSPGLATDQDVPLRDACLTQRIWRLIAWRHQELVHAGLAADPTFTVA